MPPPRDTIYALSSGRLPAAIAVVRISGPRAGDALKILSGRVPEPRKAALARVRDPHSGELIDEALALWFPGPNSETGEDTAELQLHGGRAVVAATFKALGQIEGLRPAEAGEFTRRAFENGKLDLTAVEGLADLVYAETEGQRRQALRQMKGALAQRADAWREKLIQALALVEAGIDFSDDGDVPDNLRAPALAIARELEAEIGGALDDDRRGERLREGMVVAIAGPPNAGKSTLLNRIARREAAIVSPYAGTTRDVIEVHLDLHGLPLTLLDTAGIRETEDPVEIEGVRRARARAAAADLVLWVEDASAPGPMDESVVRAGTGSECPSLEMEAQHPGPPAEMPLCSRPTGSLGNGSQAAPAPTTARSPPVWLILNKSDLVASRAPLPDEPKQAQVDHAQSRQLQCDERNESKVEAFEYKICISALTGAGLEKLISALTRKAAQLLDGEEPSLITRERHRKALMTARDSLRRAIEQPLAEDLLAEELRLAARALARLTGRIDVEDVLDVIFRDFCVGK